MYALVCIVVWCHSRGGPRAADAPSGPALRLGGQLAMRNHLRLPTLAFLIMLVATACSGGTPSSAAPSTGGEASAPAAESPSAAPSESPSAEAAAPTPEPAADCAQSTADNAMEMWERSGGNKGMVDQLVCDWNTANPDKPINL